jgi:hypothetical protein
MPRRPPTTPKDIASELRNEELKEMAHDQEIMDIAEEDGKSKSTFKIPIHCPSCGKEPRGIKQEYQTVPVVSGLFVVDFEVVSPSIMTASCSCSHTWELEGVHDLGDVIEIPEPTTPPQESEEPHEHARSNSRHRGSS